MAVFVDTGAWFAYFVRRDTDHPAAVRWMKTNRQPLVTTDYILDELLTLLKLRESTPVAVAAGESVLEQGVARLEYVTPEDFENAWQAFRQYRDKEWSFTDCTSKVVMERLGIAQAFAFDHHFDQFGSVVGVPSRPEHG
ncbi:MAG: type II toxin-antitoxin system VapC family toxin [Planctomycetes bacterium]|nr:type II toxin-antitoxin system VapC family toxin [Planctomycetota bacterium]